MVRNVEHPGVEALAVTLEQVDGLPKHVVGVAQAVVIGIDDALTVAAIQLVVVTHRAEALKGQGVALEIRRAMTTLHVQHHHGVVLLPIQVLAIGLGATLGAWLRWGLGLKLNALFPSVPPGTVAANMIGGYIIGLAIAFFAATPNLSPEWRLLLITRFCGGLTTFSTFSAETVTLIQQGRLVWALSAVGIHVMGSLVMTATGLLTFQLFSGR